jgi:hypothetical protein
MGPLTEFLTGLKPFFEPATFENHPQEMQAYEKWTENSKAFPC